MATKSVKKEAKTKLSLSTIGVWTLFFAAFIGGLSSSFYLPAAIHIKFDLHTTQILVKLAMTIYLAGVSLGSFCLSPFTDSFGIKRVFIILFVIYTLANLVCSFTGDMHIFIFARFWQGFAAVAGASLSLALIAEYLTGNRYKSATYVLVALISLGPAIGPTLGASVLELMHSWRLLFILLAVGSAAGIFLLWSFIPDDKPSKNLVWQNLKGDVAKITSQARFWLYCIMAGIGFGCFFLFLSLSPYLFEDFYHWSHIEYALVGIGAGLGMSGGSIFEKVYLNKWSAQKTIMFGLLISMVASLLISLLAFWGFMSGWLLLLLATAMLFGCGLFATTAIERAMDITRGASDTAAGVLIGIKIGIASMVSATATIISTKPDFVGTAFALILTIGVAVNYFVRHDPKK